MCLVIDQLKVIDGERIDAFHFRVELHLREWVGFAGELELGLLEVVGVKVEVAEGVDEVACFVAADLCDHFCEEGIRGDVEGDA